VLDQGEECDDGNDRALDGCTPECFLEEGACDDGILQRLRGETCEPAITPPDAFLSCDPNTCTLISAFCGNAILNAGEECDKGAENSDTPNALCRTNCMLPRCGDGIIDSWQESCDDGNRLNFDGCNNHCLLEWSAAPQTLPAQVTELPLVVPPAQGGNAPAIPSMGQPGMPLSPQIYAPPTQSPPAQPGTGPGAIAAMAAGAAAGWSAMQRRRK
jgi:cysteine-rich repeat protein